MIIEIDSLDRSELQIYASLTEAQLKNYTKDNGLFICESPKVIRVAIERGYKPISFLCERKHISGDAKDIIEKFNEVPVYTGSREILSNLTGYILTRGVLCAMKRPRMLSIDEICADANLVCVLQGITDTTNIGAIFRSASALGVDGIILSDDTCDPLNRRAVRVSMGTVFTVPWTFIENPVGKLNSLGFETAALALKENSITLDNTILKKCPKLAVVFGTEGDGLPENIISLCKYIVKIPMQHGVDSLNVGAAAAVTFWELRNKKKNIAE